MYQLGWVILLGLVKVGLCKVWLRLVSVLGTQVGLKNLYQTVWSSSGIFSQIASILSSPLL